MKSFRCRAAAVTVILMLPLLLTAPASAHAVKQIGPYVLSVGWRDEPVYVDSVNAVTVQVHDAKGRPVDDIGDQLNATVTYGGLSTAPLRLEPSFDADSGTGTHGLFEAAIVPTQIGDYRFHLTGSIEGVAVDVDIPSGPETFNSVEPSDKVMFPTKEQTPAQLTQNLSTLRARVDAASRGAHAAATLGTAALAVGAALCIGAVSLALMARRRPEWIQKDLLASPMQTAVE